MITYFPLMYLAYVYTFSMKDKFVFAMHLFALLCISLAIGVIFCILSIINGMTYQLSNYSQQYDHINLIIPNPSETVINKMNQQIKSITDLNIDKVVTQPFKISYLIVGKSNMPINLLEAISQKEPIVLSKGAQTFLGTNKEFSLISHLPKLSNSIDINIEPLTLLNSRVKKYKQWHYQSVGGSEFYATLNHKDYQAILKDQSSIIIKIHLKDLEKTDQVLEKVTSIVNANETYKIKVINWKSMYSEWVNAFELQKRILYLLCGILFILLAALIIAVNIAFFKEKRKDWALLSMYKLSYAVERIFIYKSILAFLISTAGGLTLGYYLATYSNELIQWAYQFTHLKVQLPSVSGKQELIPYQFIKEDVISLTYLTGGLFLLNIIMMIMLYHKESVSDLMKNDN